MKASRGVFHGLLWPFLGALSVAGYGVAVHELANAPRVSASQEMQVAFPRFIQVTMAAGDRYLAANLAGFRVLVAETQKMNDINFAVQAKLQQDIAWLNPGNEDNYYIANAVLPWNGHLEATQYVLQRAMTGRPNDWSPVFYYAFNLYHFKRDPATAAQWLLKAAERPMSENDSVAVQNIAARWFEKGYQPSQAAALVEGIAEQSRSSGFKKYLYQRAQRIRMLAKLQDTVAVYRARHGRAPKSLRELVTAGLLPALPVDPFGFGFMIDGDGNAILLNAPRNDTQ